MSRQCGERVAGGIYAECRLVQNGKPLEYFLIDPPKPSEDLHLASLGQTLVQFGEHHHIVDVVGQASYPNVCDFLEESRVRGVSRRLSPKLDFSKLKFGARIIFAHDRAFIENWEEYPSFDCPKQLPYHDRGLLLEEPEIDKRMCAGVWWKDIDEATFGKRELACGYTYSCSQRPKGVKPRYRQALFYWQSITNIAVLRGSNKTAENVEIAKESGLPVMEVDE